jgi:hypothetical protein
VKTLGVLLVSLVLMVGLFAGAIALSVPTPPKATEPPALVIAGDNQIPGLPGLIFGPAPDYFDKLPRYDTLHEAAAAAAVRLYACSRHYECGVVIAADAKGKYVIGPRLSSEDAGDHTDISHEVPPDWTSVADIHAHPCLSDSHEVDFFSPQDIMEYQTLKITGFMLDQCTGDIHEFVPGRDSPNDTEMPGNPGEYSTHGKIIGHIPVDHKIVEPVLS